VQSLLIVFDLAAGGASTADQLSDAVTKQSQTRQNKQPSRHSHDGRSNSGYRVGQPSHRPAAAASPGALRRMVLVRVRPDRRFGDRLRRWSCCGLLSDRLWLRVEVASALGSSVLVSVRKITPPRGACAIRVASSGQAVYDRRAVDRQRVARAIEEAVPEPGHRQCLAILCVNNSDEMRSGVVSAAIDLQNQGRMATIVDLTETGRVASAVARTAGATGDDTPVVFRPRVVPSLADGPTHIDSADWEEVALANGKKQVTLIHADLDTAIGVDHLTAGQIPSQWP
jgi:hypothetical protein